MEYICPGIPKSYIHILTVHYAMLSNTADQELYIYPPNPAKIPKCVSSDLEFVAANLDFLLMRFS